MDDAVQPELEFAFEARIDIGPSEHIGHGEGDELTFTPITGGTVDGLRLRGVVLPGGGDWAVERGTTTQLDARYLIRTDDGSLIDIVNRGYYRASREVLARLEAGEPVDPAEVYFRTSPVFRTDAPAHRWLAETVFIGLARDEGQQVCIRFYAVR
jgi:Protein of unknown function (DUF3237)